MAGLHYVQLELSLHDVVEVAALVGDVPQALGVFEALESAVTY